jgi:type I restriction enzyme R subunit
MEVFERGQFKAQGGFNRINKAFDGKLEEILGEINSNLWENAS